MEPLSLDLDEIDGCWFYVDFNNWSKVFVVVGLGESCLVFLRILDVRCGCCYLNFHSLLLESRCACIELTRMISCAFMATPLSFFVKYRFDFMGITMDDGRFFISVFGQYFVGTYESDIAVTYHSSHHPVPSQVMFESERYGISIQNWRRLGKKRIDESNIFNVAQKASFKFFIAIFTLNSWLLFGAKVCMFLTFGDGFYTAWTELGFTRYFNIEIALITLLMISNIFFSFPILPSFQIASTRSTFVRGCLYLLYLEIFSTYASCLAVLSCCRRLYQRSFIVFVWNRFVLLCVQYPILISVLYIGACIVLTGMILGMAILCLLALVIISGSIIFWTLNCITLCHFQGTQYLKAFSASITWLLITYLVWVSGVCLAFLFTTSNFQSTLCFEMEGNLYEELALIFVISTILITIISLFILHFAFGEMTPVPEPMSSVGNEKEYQYHPVANQGVEEMEQI